MHKHRTGSIAHNIKSLELFVQRLRLLVSSVHLSVYQSIYSLPISQSKLNKLLLTTRGDRAWKKRNSVQGKYKGDELVKMLLPIEWLDLMKLT